MQNWFPENVSTFGADVDGIFWLIFYITTIWFFITEGLILYFIFRYRRRPGKKAVYATGDTWSQLAWVLIPMAIVVKLSFKFRFSRGIAVSHVLYRAASFCLSQS